MKKILFLFALCCILLSPASPSGAKDIRVRRCFDEPAWPPIAFVLEPGSPYTLFQRLSALPYAFYLFGDESYAKALATRQPELRERYPNGLTVPMYLGYMVIHNDYRVEYTNASPDFGMPAEEELAAYNSLPPDAMYKVSEIRAMHNDSNFLWIVESDPENFHLPRWSWNAAMCIMDEMLTKYRIHNVFWSRGLKDKDHRYRCPRFEWSGNAIDEDFVPRFKYTRLLSWDELDDEAFEVADYWEELVEGAFAPPHVPLCLEELPHVGLFQAFRSNWICHGREDSR